MELLEPKDEEEMKKTFFALYFPGSFIYQSFKTGRI